MPLARHDRNAKGAPVADAVSTHMPLARHDLTPEQCAAAGMVSTHMPLARHDHKRITKAEHEKFLLTCLLRGMTGIRSSDARKPRFLLTCLLRGMTLCDENGGVSIRVSTHMPLARHDIPH